MPARARLRPSATKGVNMDALHVAALRMAAARKTSDDTPRDANGWPTVYRHRVSGKQYRPHNDAEAMALTADRPRRILVKGGEGSGKSVMGIIKCLERLRRGMSGCMGSPDLQHFKRSLWREFVNWCPWDMVTPSQRHRQNPEWEPASTFIMTFTNGAQLICGGYDDPGSWEGPNLNFGMFDEARRHRTPAMLKVLDGRCRIPGPKGEPPQFWYTTTPKKHWLFTFFGPITSDDADNPQPDPYEDFKRDSLTVTLRTDENIENVDPDFYRTRKQSLTEIEKRVLMDAEWYDLDDADKFLADMILWDNLKENLPPLTRGEPLILAADAGVSKDSFGLVGVGRHPFNHRRPAVRLVKEWKPEPGRPLDFDAIQTEIETLCREQIRAIHLAYDPYQLHQMMTGLANRGIVPTKPFSQQAERAVADKGLYDAIEAGELAHDGDAQLREHINNANKERDDDRKRLRLVKRELSLKIDLSVALSMALARWRDPKISLPSGDTVGVDPAAMIGAIAGNVLAGSTR